MHRANVAGDARSLRRVRRAGNRHLPIHTPANAPLVTDEKSYYGEINDSPVRFSQRPPAISVIVFDSRSRAINPRREIKSVPSGGKISVHDLRLAIYSRRGAFSRTIIRA